jgi:hypothetical protein
MEQMMERLLAKMDAIQKKTDATLKEIIEDMRACREATEANPEEVKFTITVHEKVPKEVETFEALKE